MILLLLCLAEQDTTNQQSIELKIYQDQKMTQEKNRPRLTNNTI